MDNNTDQQNQPKSNVDALIALAIKIAIIAAVVGIVDHLWK